MTFRYTEKLSTKHTTASTITHTAVVSHRSTTLSPAVIPEGQSERLILKNMENSVRGKILFLDLELQQKLLDFLLSPTGSELTKLEIDQFLHSKQDFNFLTQMNNALKMLNNFFDDSQQLQNQINNLAKLFFVSTLNGDY